MPIKAGNETEADFFFDSLRFMQRYHVVIGIYITVIGVPTAQYHADRIFSATFLYSTTSSLLSEKKHGKKYTSYRWLDDGSHLDRNRTTQVEIGPILPTSDPVQLHLIMTYLQGLYRTEG